MSDQITIALIGAISAVLGAIIQAQSSIQTAQPKSARNRQIFLGAVAGLILGIAVGLATTRIIPNMSEKTPNMSKMEYDTDRPGGEDYSVFTVESPEMCQDACARESRCQAWAYVAPNTKPQQSEPRCYLKSSTPQKIPDNCCISGRKIL
jgi:PAN domain